MSLENRDGFYYQEAYRKDTIRTFGVVDLAVEITPEVTYLGVILDSKLTFWANTRRASDNGAVVTASLSRVMANIDCSSPCKQRLLIRAVESTMLYGAEVWVDELRIEKYRKRMAAVHQRGALRVESSYRTLSAVAGVVPINLLALERKFVIQDLSRLTVADRTRVNSFRL